MSFSTDLLICKILITFRRFLRRIDAKSIRYRRLHLYKDSIAHFGL